MTIADLNPYNPSVNGCMVTYTGRVVNLWDVDPELIVLEDIAHGLGMNCRWNGHTKRWYSIAEHCLRVCNQFDSKEMKLLALFHDAEEAYWGDMIRPLKSMLRQSAPEVLAKMKDLRAVIFAKFGIKDSTAYKDVDDAEIRWDFENLVLNDRHIPMSPLEAKNAWMQQAVNLIDF